jgi:4a-hydroxytetrahydrobiopterin dehydratase
LKFKNFVSAVNFINKIVPIAEELEHHPDLELKNYNELIIRITTHDEGGITELDFELAKKIDELIS